MFRLINRLICFVCFWVCVIFLFCTRWLVVLTFHPWIVIVTLYSPVQFSFPSSFQLFHCFFCNGLDLFYVLRLFICLHFVFFYLYFFINLFVSNFFRNIWFGCMALKKYNANFLSNQFVEQIFSIKIFQIGSRVILFNLKIF